MAVTWDPTGGKAGSKLSVWSGAPVAGACSLTSITSGTHKARRFWTTICKLVGQDQKSQQHGVCRAMVLQGTGTQHATCLLRFVGTAVARTGIREATCKGRRRGGTEEEMRVPLSCVTLSYLGLGSSESTLMYVDLDPSILVPPNRKPSRKMPVDRDKHTSIDAQEKDISACASPSRNQKMQDEDGAKRGRGLSWSYLCCSAFAAFIKDIRPKGADFIFV
jgi:hypothetical protein